MLESTVTTARFFQFAAALVLFGTPLFYLYGFDSAVTPAATKGRSWQRPLLLISSLLAVGAAIVWLFTETALLSEEPALSLSAVSSVLLDTRFGQVTALRMGILAVTAMVLANASPRPRLWSLAAVFGAALTASFAWTGHGATTGGMIGAAHLGADILHLLAAGVWIGALVPLNFLILNALRSRSMGDAQITYVALSRFSIVGPSVVAVLALTGLINSYFLVGLDHWRELPTTSYGKTLVVKLALFSVMLLLAAANRYRLSPRLKKALIEPICLQSTLGALRMSLLAETIIGMFILLDVALLTSLEPIAGPDTVSSAREVALTVHLGQMEFRPRASTL